MAVNYLHGVETIEVEQGPRTVRVVKSSVITLVGIAPTGPVNTPTMVVSQTQAAQFGEMLPGFTIPQALNAIFQQGPATVIVTNVFNSVTNTEAVEVEAHTITEGKIKLSAAPIGAVEVFLTDGETPFTGVEGTDYSIDAFGNFQALSAVASEGLALKFTFNKLDFGSVTNDQIIGTITGDVRTGMKTWETIFTTFGFYPKILIAPVFVETLAIATEMRTLETKYRAIGLYDSPVGTSHASVIAGRGPASTMNFKTSSDRSYLLHPHLKAYEADSDSNVNVPYSSYMAGVIARTDANEGYWVSPSNHEILGIVGTELTVTASINDPATDANTLNENGITTTFTGFGTGTRTWGNRSAAWPSNITPKNFIPVRRTADIVHESLEQAMLPFIDKPINQATIDAIRETGNAFFRTLIGRGACLPGSKCVYSEENTPEELALGHVVFDLVFMVPTPAERITFKSYLDINLLAQIV